MEGFGRQKFSCSEKVLSPIEGAADSTLLWWSGPQVPQLLGLEHFVSCLTLPVQLKFSETNAYINTVIGGGKKKFSTEASRCQ